MLRLLTPLFALSLLTGCETAYINTMEQFGVHKRDILADRIVDVQDAQADGQEQFRSALEQFRSVINVDGGELEKQYDKLQKAYDDSEAAAEKISKRIDKVESVAEALFDEWDDELDQYTNQRLRADSERKLKNTQRGYEQVMRAMRASEKSLEPVLNALRDNTLYLKHNLNASAIGALRGEYRNVNSNVEQLLKAMEKSIAESDAFIKTLE
ncbi:hypothetical protein FHR99_003002 [Litorivivens lipolytica]|uniref:DUF2959 domain-containing protein n=1 Tax=Litorivivens lipolytica TaxID=1524264 RepID=A0A7W4W753_9GAMM|nr:DUF2959 domain-containing protein [Litorivivens lipolytica]MBB3048728.1 hypothetical protein [Litorivivens lipolytica]